MKNRDKAEKIKSLQKDIEQTQKSIAENLAKVKAKYLEVKDFDDADFVKTEYAMKAITMYNSEISSLRTTLRRMQAQIDKLLQTPESESTLFSNNGYKNTNTGGAY
jgi:ABC-type Zn2+ transport system substrate-binding protein/surface adhesin